VTVTTNRKSYVEKLKKIALPIRISEVAYTIKMLKTDKKKKMLSLCINRTKMMTRFYYNLYAVYSTNNEYIVRTRISVRRLVVVWYRSAMKK